MSKDSAKACAFRVKYMEGDSKVKAEIDLVEELTKQIITLSTSILVIMATVMGYYFQSLGRIPFPNLSIIVVSATLFLISIFVGILVYGVLISSIHRSRKLEEVNIYSSNLRIFALGQWSSFILGIILLAYSIYQIALS